MISTDAVVIVGAGQAGAAAALGLRDAGHQGPISLLGAEGQPPYQRPPLSKKFLTGAVGPAQLILHGEEAFEAKKIDLLLHLAAARIDRDNRRVHATDGRVFDYDQLVLATGVRNRALPTDRPGTRALSLRGWADAEALRAELQRAESVLIVGAGMIGLEVAASARELGKEVLVIEGAPTLLPRHVSRPVADFLLALHTDRGVRVQRDTSVETLLVGDDGRVNGARTSSGELFADLVVDAVGVTPETDLAADAGLDVEHGILVDPWLRTSDPRVSAIGDCATVIDGSTGGRLHLESVQNAADQGAYVARRLVAGEAAPYRAVPWFWSDQFGVRIQMAGLSVPGQEELLVGSGDRFSVFCFDGPNLHRVESVGMPGEHLAARRVLGARRSPDRDEVTRPDFSLKRWWAECAATYDLTTTKG